MIVECQIFCSSAWLACWQWRITRRKLNACLCKLNNIISEKKLIDHPQGSGTVKRALKSNLSYRPSVYEFIMIGVPRLSFHYVRFRCFVCQRDGRNLTKFHHTSITQTPWLSPLIDESLWESLSSVYYLSLNNQFLIISHLLSFLTYNETWMCSFMFCVSCCSYMCVIIWNKIHTLPFTTNKIPMNELKQKSH